MVSCYHSRGSALKHAQRISYFVCFWCLLIRILSSFAFYQGLYSIQHEHLVINVLLAPYDAYTALSRSPNEQQEIQDKTQSA